MVEQENILMRELTQDELTIVGGGINWVNVVKAVLAVTAATAIGGAAAGAMVAGDIVAGSM